MFDLPVKAEQEYEKFRRENKSALLTECYSDAAKQFLHDCMKAVSLRMFRYKNAGKDIIPGTKSDIFAGMYYSDTGVKPDNKSPRVKCYAVIQRNNAGYKYSLSYMEELYGKDIYNICCRIRSQITDDLRFILFIRSRNLSEWYKNRMYSSIQDIISISRAETGLPQEMYDLFSRWNMLNAELPLPPGLLYDYDRAVQNIQLSDTDDTAYIAVLQKSTSWIYMHNYRDTDLPDRTAEDIIRGIKPYRRHAFCRVCIDYLFAGAAPVLTEVNDILYIFECYTRFINKLTDASLTYANVFRWGSFDVYYTRAAQGRRLATFNEKRNLAEGVVCETQYYRNDRNISKGLLFCAWLQYGSKNDLTLLADELPVIKYARGLSSQELKKLLPAAAYAVHRYIDKQFLRSDMDYADMHSWYMNQPVYPETAADEVNSVPRESLVFRAAETKGDTQLEKLGRNIARQVRSKKITYDALTDAQIRVLQSVYAKAVSGKTGVKQSTADDEKILLQAKEIVDNKDYILKQFPGMNFAYQVCVTVVQYNRVSEKQQPYVTSLYNMLIKQRNKGRQLHPELTEQVLNAQDKNAGQQQSLFSMEEVYDQTGR